MLRKTIGGGAETNAASFDRLFTSGLVDREFRENATHKERDPVPWYRLRPTESNV